jgi:hypothetical protein
VALEQRISASDGWFVGEDKVLRFTVDGDTDGISGWQLGFRVFAAKAKEGDLPLVEVLSGGGAIVASEATADAPAIVTVVVSAEQSVVIGAGPRQFVLARVDPGSRNVLSYGTAALQSAVSA